MTERAADSTPGPVVVIGAGKAGFETAIALRASGWNDRIVLVGDEDALPYERPPLSKDFLAGKMERDDVLIDGAVRLPQLEIEFHRATSVERLDLESKEVVLSTGESIRYSHVVLATGARPRRLTVPGADLEGVVHLRTLADAEVLKTTAETTESLVVIGGGYVGLEVAAHAASLGVRVRVLEGMSRLLNRSALPETSEHALRHHRAVGIEVNLDVRISELVSDHDGRVRGVLTEDGTLFEAETVLCAIGIEPCAELAERAGLAVANGIQVDESLRTSAPHVWAIGDCASFPVPYLRQHARLESVQNAVEQARFVASAIVSGQPGVYRAVPWVASKQGALTVQAAGLTGNHDSRVVYGDPDSGGFSTLAFDGETLVGIDAINSPRHFLAARRVLTQELNGTPSGLTLERARSSDFRLEDFGRRRDPEVVSG
ncbi:MAG: FAD-dependent oxidoreductase [Cryobacterium sp.]|nr:FAD-dependent oxidoreductase [Cryobacterium sp.]